MNLTALLRIQSENSGEQPNNINLIVASALIFIVENYFLKLAQSFVLTLSYREKIVCKYYNDILEKMFRTWVAPPMQMVNIKPNRTQYVPGSRELNLILVDSYESFRAIDVISYTAHYNHNEYYYIFLQNYDDVVHTEMTKIFDYCWENYIINCNIQIQNHQGEILIYTYFPFTAESCGKVTLKLINQFKDGALTNEVLFPKKLLNFHGCPLRVAMWHTPPFNFMQEFSNGSGFIEHGIETRLVKMLAKKLNFTLTVKVPANQEQRGIVVNNGKITGALSMLQERTADFAVGCFRFALERLQVATATVCYYQTSVVLAVPLDVYALSSLEILLYPFSGMTWFLLSAIWVLVTFLIWLLKRYYRSYHQPQPYGLNDQTYLNMLLVAIGMPSTAMPTRFATRLFCLNWLIFTFLLRITYQAFLFHLIRTQLTNRLPTTIAELIAENFTIVMNKLAFAAIKDVQVLTELNPYIIDDVNQTIAFDYIEKNSKKNLVATGGRDFFIYYITEYRKSGVFQLLRENIFAMPIAMYLTNHSYLLNRFNEELMNFCSMGFIQAWTKWELDYDYLRYRYIQNDVLGLNDLSMVFVLGFSGMMFAGFVFFLEIWSTRIPILQKFFLKY